MGDIELCPESGKIEDSVKEIKELDLSYLGEEKAKQLRSLLLKYADVFNNKPGCCNTYKHQINLVDGFVAKRQHPYRIPVKLQEEVDKQIDQLLLDGKIRTSNSQFGAPLLCVVKKTGISVCVPI